MILKPQDIVILLKIVALGEGQWSYASLAADLAMSTSEVHAGIKRAVAARLMDVQRRPPPDKIVGRIPYSRVKYAFPPDHGGLTRGIPTGYAAPPLRDMISQPNEPPPYGRTRKAIPAAMNSRLSTSPSRRPLKRILPFMNCWP